jgi:hypothetical protein
MVRMVTRYFFAILSWVNICLGKLLVGEQTNRAGLVEIILVGYDYMARGTSPTGAFCKVRLANPSMRRAPFEFLSHGSIHAPVPAPASRS